MFGKVMEFFAKSTVTILYVGLAIFVHQVVNSYQEYADLYFKGVTIHLFDFSMSMHLLATMMNWVLRVSLLGICISGILVTWLMGSKLQQVFETPQG